MKNLKILLTLAVTLSCLLSCFAGLTLSAAAEHQRVAVLCH